MTPRPIEEQRRRIEWELLQSLCSGALAGPDRRQAMELLAGYSFSDAVRQSIFDEVSKLERTPTDILRQELASRLTRRGFPDADFDSLFAPAPFSAKQALESTRELLRSAGTSK